MNKLLKKAIVLILCLTFTSSLMSVANANKENVEKLENIEIYNRISELEEANIKLAGLAIEEAKKIVCENLKISRELLDETIKDVRIQPILGKVTEYTPASNIIEVSPSDVTSITGNIANKLAREMGRAFVDNFMNKNREEIACKNIIMESIVILCDNNIIASENCFISDDVLSCCNENNERELFEAQYRRYLKYLAQNWLAKGKTTPSEVLTMLNNGKSAKAILLETGGEKIYDILIKENTIGEKDL